MSQFKQFGKLLREAAKNVILKYMQQEQRYQPQCTGISQAELFRSCGLDWGNYTSATSSNQQYWIVALPRELEAEGRTKRLA